MAIEVSFTVPQPEFPLNTVFEQLPDATIELDRVVPTDDAIIPYFWINAENVGDLTPD